MYNTFIFSKFFVKTKTPQISLQIGIDYMEKTKYFCKINIESQNQIIFKRIIVEKYKQMNLSELNSGESAIITKVNGEGDFRKRITEMGFVKGQRVFVIKNAPLKDPIEYRLMGYEISLRRSEASLVEVSTEDISNAETVSPQTFETIINTHTNTNDKKIKVALVGNPNCGKTTLFNLISGLHERVGNYSGVTVGAKSASIDFEGYNIEFTDLPGTYSLSAYSPEEIYVREHIAEKNPDIIVNVLDSTNLERNLYLTTQLIDIEAPLVIALNMYDEFQKIGDKFNHETMGELLNATIIPTVAKRERGVINLLRGIIQKYESLSTNTKSIEINYGIYNEKHIKTVIDLISEHNTTKYPNRFVAIKLLEGDSVMVKDIESEELLEKIKVEQNKIFQENGEISETVFTDARYGFISGALKETYKKSLKQRNCYSHRIDYVLTDKYFSFPIFLGIMWLIFYGTFTLGEYPMMLIEKLIEYLQEFSNMMLPEGAINDLITNGIIGGVGSVIVFLPNILLLFLFISILEDTGYMARAAFIMDKLMHRIGLHGKSFIPLVMGFGCSVPAVMATRIIESKDNRILTMLITPFMSCSAKLPVYILILGTFFPENAGNLLFVIYFLGILVAIGTSILFNKFIFKGQDKPFVMELPPYRMPYFKSSMKHMWLKGSQYLQKMGGIILVAVVIIWVLSYYPQNPAITEKYNQEKAVVENLYQQTIQQTNSPLIAQQQKDSVMQIINTQHESEQLNNSYLAQMGKLIEPVVRPLGFDWKMGVCLTAGVAAKEIIVSTMGVINQADTEETDDGSSPLQRALRSAKNDKGEFVYNKATGISFLIFTLIYFPCIATVTAIRKESGHAKWLLLTVFYSTGLAWVMSFIFYNIAKFFLL